MNAIYSQATIETISDEMIFEEAAKRLQAVFQKSNSKPLMYGSFRFIFHDGRLQSVEECPRYRIYQSPRKTKVPSTGEVPK